MIGHLRDEIENSRKTSFSDLFSDGKPAEISRDFEPTALSILFTCVVPHKPRFGAGQQKFHLLLLCSFTGKEEII